MYSCQSRHLVKFAQALGPSRLSPLLDRSSLERMFARPGITGYYPDGTPKEIYMACGWYVRTRPDGRRVAYHRGLLDGTSTLLVLGGDGMDWAVFFHSDTGPRDQELADLRPVRGMCRETRRPLATGAE